MGALFELPTALNATGYLSLPSPTKAAPASGESYFQGGYNVDTHGSQDGGSIDGVQIEFPRYIRAQEFGMQEDVLVAFGETVLPQMLALNYPAACDVLGNTPIPRRILRPAHRRLALRQLALRRLALRLSFQEYALMME